jgi:hypothetical protein
MVTATTTTTTIINYDSHINTTSKFRILRKFASTTGVINTASKFRILCKFAFTTAVINTASKFQILCKFASTTGVINTKSKFRILCKFASTTGVINTTSKFLILCKFAFTTAISIPRQNPELSDQSLPAAHLATLKLFTLPQQVKKDFAAVSIKSRANISQALASSLVSRYGSGKDTTRQLDYIS